MGNVPKKVYLIRFCDYFNESFAQHLLLDTNSIFEANFCYFHFLKHKGFNIASMVTTNLEKLVSKIIGYVKLDDKLSMREHFVFPNYCYNIYIL